MKDLQPGMILKGTVRNVIDFGAFVDLVYISEEYVRKFRKKSGPINI